MTQNPKKQQQKQGGMSWAQAARDIVVTSMNRGQLPILGMIAVAMVLVLKMDEVTASAFVVSIVEALKSGALLGYFLFVVSIAGWFFHAKWMRKMFSQETKRIGREKSGLQSALSGQKFQSSDRKSRRS